MALTQTYRLQVEGQLNYAYAPLATIWGRLPFKLATPSFRAKHLPTGVIEQQYGQPSVQMKQVPESISPFAFRPWTRRRAKLLFPAKVK